MKRRINLLIILLLTAITCWFLGYLRFPYVEFSDFLQGLLIGLGVPLSLFFLLKILYPNNESKRKVNRGALFLIMPLVILLSASILLLYQNAELKKDNKKQLQLTKEKDRVIFNLKQGQQLLAVNELLNSVNQELQFNEEKKLGENTIQRIAAFSDALSLIQNENDSTMKYIVGRGQLLLGLIHLSIDSVSFGEIIKHVDFSKAALQGAKLNKQQLDGIQLQGANLNKAKLDHTSLRNANLKNVNLNEASLNNVVLRNADLQNSSLEWVKAENANFSNANLNGANLSNSIIPKSNFQYASFIWTKLDYCLLNETNMERTELFQTSFIGSKLKNTKFFKASIQTAKFSLSTLSMAQLNHAYVNLDWYNQLKVKKFTEVSQLDKEYALVEEKNKTNTERYYLKSNKN